MRQSCDYCHTSGVPASSATMSTASPLSEAAVRDLIREEVTAAVAAALSRPASHTPGNGRATQRHI